MASAVGTAVSRSYAVDRERTTVVYREPKWGKRREDSDGSAGAEAGNPPYSPGGEQEEAGPEDHSSGFASMGSLVRVRHRPRGQPRQSLRTRARARSTRGDQGGDRARRRRSDRYTLTRGLRPLSVGGR